MEPLEGKQKMLGNKLRKIIIKLPDKESWWRVSFVGSVKRKSIKSVWGRIERKLLKESSFLEAHLKAKTAVLLKDGHNVVNETLPSFSAGYLLYCTACFLEEYLPKGLLNRKLKRYLKFAQDY